MKLPPDPKTYYTQNPDKPSQRKTAKLYGLGKTTIANRSIKEKWVEKRDQFRSKADAKTEEKAIETISDMNVRHYTALTKVEQQCEDTLDSCKFLTAGEALKGMDMSIKGQRTIKGEPTDRQDLSIVFRVEETKKKKK